MVHRAQEPPSGLLGGHELNGSQQQLHHSSSTQTVTGVGLTSGVGHQNASGQSSSGGGGGGSNAVVGNQNGAGVGGFSNNNHNGYGNHSGASAAASNNNGVPNGSSSNHHQSRRDQPSRRESRIGGLGIGYTAYQSGYNKLFTQV